MKSSLLYNIVLRGLLCGAAILLSLLATLQAGASEVPGQTTIGFSFAESEEAEVFHGQITLLNTAYFLDQEPYCQDDCRTPDGDKYDHSHISADFSFFFPPYDMWIHRMMSDWAWDRVYGEENRLSNSTLKHNCYSHAAPAPNLIGFASWLLFTEESSMCEETEAPKSFCLDWGHAIRIAGTEKPPYSEDCLITETTEKMASSGVYRQVFLMPGGKSLDEEPVGKRKQDNN